MTIPLVPSGSTLPQVVRAMQEYGKVLTKLTRPTQYTPGDVIQSQHDSYATYSSTTTQIPTDNTIPQSSEGAEILTVSITPKQANSKLRVRYGGFGLCPDIASVTAAIFRDSGADALHASTNSNAASYYIPVSGEFEVSAGSTAATTFKIRVGPNTSTTLYFNGDASSRTFGGVAGWYLTIEEIAQEYS